MEETKEDTNHFNFTIDKLNAVECPPSGKPDKSGRVYVYDNKQLGLAFCVTEGEARSFYVYKKIAGKPVRLRLGSFNDLKTIEQARSLASKKLLAIANDVNPQALKVAARQAPTLGDMWTTYVADVKKGERTMGEDLGLWRRYLEPWAGRRVADVRMEDVQMLYNKIAAGDMNREIEDSQGHKRPVKGGATAANRTMALLSGMFSACGRKFGVAGFNPCSEIRKGKESACDRYLSEEEMPAFWSAVGKQSQSIQDLVKLALFTAQRRWTLFTMRWDEINLNFKTWTVPANKMKSGKAHVIPLAPEAMEILTRRREAAPEGEQWVLNAPSDTGHIEEPKKAIKAIVKAAGIQPVTLHDLRRTTATWMNSTGTSESIIAAVLAHKYRNITGIYARATEDAKRQGLERAVAAIVKAGTAKPKRTRKAKAA